MVIIVMGVSGSGKTHIGKLLAKTLSVSFRDADEFHPPSNVKKMEQGIALTDADRQPWLDTLAEHIAQWDDEDGVVLACSALKESYRESLTRSYTTDVQFVYLQGSKELILSRMQARNHFFPPQLLDSQFADLEEPQQAITVRVDQTPEAMVMEIVRNI